MGLSKDDVPQGVEDSIMNLHGELNGQQWLSHALDQVNELETDWDFNTVGVMGGEDALLVKVEPSTTLEDFVVKVPSDVKSGCDEITALKIWEDCSVPVVINEDLSTGVFMMDYVTSIDKEVSPFQAFVLADVLHSPAINFDYDFPSLEENVTQRIKSAYRNEFRSNNTELDLAVKTLETLVSTQDHHELLHGDYRNDNIIYSENGPVILSPQPCVGDSLFDIALWLAESRDYDDIAVVLQLAATSASRLIPWTWALSVILHENNSDALPAAGALKHQVFKWLEQN